MTSPFRLPGPSIASVPAADGLLRPADVPAALSFLPPEAVDLEGRGGVAFLPDDLRVTFPPPQKKYGNTERQLPAIIPAGERDLLGCTFPVGRRGALGGGRLTFGRGLSAAPAFRGGCLTLLATGG